MATVKIKVLKDCNILIGGEVVPFKQSDAVLEVEVANAANFRHRVANLPGYIKIINESVKPKTDVIK